MKSSIFPLLVMGLLPVAVPAQRPASPPRLAGIINLPGTKRAILETDQTGRMHQYPLILGKGEGERDWEVTEIRPEEGTVWVRGISGTNAAVGLTNATLRAGTVAPGIAFENAGLDAILNLYAEFAGRTVLRFPRLPATTFTLSAPAANPREAARVLENALTNRELVIILDGTKFTMVVPRTQEASVKPASPTSSPSGPLSQIVAPGYINFLGTDLTQVAVIYADILGRKLDRSRLLPWDDEGIKLRTQTALSKAEAFYALDTLFLWRGWKLVPVGDDSMKPVEVSAAAK